MCLFIFILQNWKLEANIYLTWCAFEHQVRKSSLTLWCRGKKRAMPKSRGKSVHLGGRPAKPHGWSAMSCGLPPWSNSYVALTTLQSMWWYMVLLLLSVSYGNNLKLLKFLIFEVFSCYLWLHFILSMITICYNIKLYLMCLILMKTKLAYIALVFGPELCNSVSWANILGNVLPRCWWCDIILFESAVKSCCLLVIHMSDLPFPNLKLTYTAPRAKYE
jgi:hypothetical protein